MLVITIARKPLGGTVASNSLKWGCGGINIDDSRVSCVGLHEVTQGKGSHGDDGWGMGRNVIHVPTGRWPANMIMSHVPGCQKVGSHRVKTGTASSEANGFRTEYVGGERKAVGFGGGYADDDGKEVVPSWACKPGCPVAALDEQSGLVPTGTWNRQTDTAHPFGDAQGTPYETWQEAPKEAPSGASRYFKVVGK